jgi:hypothetical protein
VCAGAQTTRSGADSLASGIEFATDRRRPLWNARRQQPKEQFMSIGTILLIVLVLIVIGVLPSWPHSRSWGYGPSGIVGLLLIVLVVLLLMGKI